MITGQDVEFVQGILWNLGLMQTSELGYGTQTQSAIMSFQEKVDLEIDGTVDQTTLKALLGAMYYVEGLDYKNLAWQWNSIFAAGPEPPQNYVDFTLPYESCIGIRKAAWPAYIKGEDKSKAIDSIVTTHFAMSAPAMTMAGANFMDKSVRFATAGLFGAGGNGIQSFNMNLQLFGKRKNKLQPHPDAVGPHSTFKRDVETGKITNYETYRVNKKHPSGFDLLIRYDWCRITTL